MWQLSFVAFFDIFHIAKSNKVILLQSATGCYYKVRQVLQIVTVITMSPAALLRFTDLKAFSNSSKVRSLYSIFFPTGNRKSSNVLDLFCILLSRFGPILVKYLLNSSAVWLFVFIDFPLTFIDLGNLLKLSLFLPVISYVICYVRLTSSWQPLIVCLISFFM